MTNRSGGSLRHLAFCALLASTVAATSRAPELQAQRFDHSLFDAIVYTHSTGKGVDYAAIKADRAPLDRYVAQLGTVSTSAFEKWPRADQIAFLLNAYNAIVIQQVIDDYPIERSPRPAAMVRPANSVWQIDGFFDVLKHRVTDRDLTLDQIEHEWLRPRFQEPRIHFALVCAAHSCPPLRREAYVAARLVEQLDDQARIFLNDRARNRFGEKNAQLSEIFKWFGSDFGTEQQLRAFLGGYLNPATASRLRNDRYRITYLDYDWTLNDVAR